MEGQQVNRSAVASLIQGGIGLLIVALAFGAFFFYTQAQSFSLISQYQAVFLNNNQVYFGTISKQTSGYIELTDVYYFQARDTETDNRAVAPGENDADYRLIKLGSEVHGPKDRMFIYRDNILYVEDLEDDSRVVKAIENYLSNTK